MNTKLTLSIDSAVIDKAKKNLQTKNKSLSGLIEDYFKLLIAAKTKQIPSPPRGNRAYWYCKTQGDYR